MNELKESACADYISRGQPATHCRWGPSQIVRWMKWRLATWCDSDTGSSIDPSAELPKGSNRSGPAKMPEAVLEWENGSTPHNAESSGVGDEEEPRVAGKSNKQDPRQKATATNKQEAAAKAKAKGKSKAKARARAVKEPKQEAKTEQQDETRGKDEEASSPNSHVEQPGTLIAMGSLNGRTLSQAFASRKRFLPDAPMPDDDQVVVAKPIPKSFPDVGYDLEYREEDRAWVLCLMSSCCFLVLPNEFAFTFYEKDGKEIIWDGVGAPLYCKDVMSASFGTGAFAAPKPVRYTPARH